MVEQPESNPSDAPGWAQGLLVAALVVAMALILSAAGWSLMWEGPWFGVAEVVVVAALVIAGVLAAYGIIQQRVALRIGVAAGLAMLVPSLRVAEVLGYPFAYKLWEVDILGNLWAVIITTGAVGLIARKSWARWLAMACAATGIASGGINGVASLLDPSVKTWVCALSMSFSLIVGLSLAGSQMRAAFERREAALWGSPDPLIRWVRWTQLTQFVAIPMLLVYALVQPIVPGTAGLAMLLASFLGLGSVLCVRRKVFGVLLLTLGGPSLLLLSAFVFWRSHDGAAFDMRIAAYYTVFWCPAGVVSTLTGVALARSVTRLSRSRSMQ